MSGRTREREAAVAVAAAATLTAMDAGGGGEKKVKEAGKREGKGREDRQEKLNVCCDHSLSLLTLDTCNLSLLRRQSTHTHTCTRLALMITLTREQHA